MAKCGLLKQSFEIEALNSELLSGPCAEEVVKGVLDAAVAAGAQTLTAATPIGHTLCGAAIIRSCGNLRLWNGGMPGPVLIVDGITASDITTKMKQARLEKLGLRAPIHIVEIAPREREDPHDTLGAVPAREFRRPPTHSAPAA